MKNAHTLVLLFVAILGISAFGTDPNAGMVAAREMGLKTYVQFQRHGKTDSAAVFFWRGNWWVYHPSMGSFKTVMDDPSEPPSVAALAIDGAASIDLETRERHSTARRPRQQLPAPRHRRRAQKWRRHPGDAESRCSSALRTIPRGELLRDDPLDHLLMGVSIL